MMSFFSYRMKSCLLLGSRASVHRRLTIIRFASLVPNHQLPDFEVKNEPFLSFLKGSNELCQLKEALAELSKKPTKIPIVIDGKEYHTNDEHTQKAPFDHSLAVADYCWASKELIEKAVDAANKRREEWERRPLSDKIKIFSKAADLVAGKYRAKMLASTMLGQGKNIYQAEIDSAGEMADFLRFNAFYAKELVKYKPISEKPKEILNHYRHRGLEGFVAAISPFNFTAIGGNLAAAPVLMGNVVLWKPSDTAVLSNYLIFKILEEAGLPPGVINFIPSDGPLFGDVITSQPTLAGINFTGSVDTFKFLWKKTAQNLDIYRNYPRLSGECGGKNYHFVHESADLTNVAVNTIRSAFEYSGQKCSACSRLYVPESKWPEIKGKMLDICKQLKLGSPLEVETFLSAVIDKKSFKRIANYLDYAKSSSDCDIIYGGSYDDSKGFFITPTIIQCSNLNDKLFNEEIFGPVLSVYVYKNSDANKMLQLINTNHKYALTGAVFAQDKNFLSMAIEELKMSAGNFYINDKSTGAIVGQQPFGGARLSGTNDKCGGPHNLLRWSSPQTIKESFINQKEWLYPYMLNH